MSNQNRSRQSRRGRPGRSTNSAVVTRAQLKRENHLIENGSKLRPGPHPTAFMSVPWFPLTVQVVGASSISMRNASLSGDISLPASIRSQIGLPTSMDLQVRIQSARVWGPLVAMNSATPLSPLRCQFHTLLTNTDAISVLEDITEYPDQVSRASLGFMWPKTQQALALSTIFVGGPPPIVRIAVGSGVNNVTYMRVLWRPVPVSFSDFTVV